jgi:hypothetical protein
VSSVCPSLEASNGFSKAACSKFAFANSCPKRDFAQKARITFRLDDVVGRMVHAAAIFARLTDNSLKGISAEIDPSAFVQEGAGGGKL